MFSRPFLAPQILLLKVSKPWLRAAVGRVVAHAYKYAVNTD